MTRTDYQLAMRASPTSIVIAAATIACVACGPSSRPAPPTVVTSASPSLTAPPRPPAAYGDSCAPAIAHARREPREPLMLPPVPAEPERALPPMPAPRGWRGRKVDVRLQVDSAGGVTDVAIETPGAEKAFGERLVRQYRALRMHPALLRGCGVPGSLLLTLEYGP